MNLAIIQPTSTLGSIGAWNNYHLCLAQQVLKDPEYTEFFRDLKEIRGDFVILDNGKAEGVSLTDEELMEAVRRLNPNVVAAPDIIGQGAESLEATHNFLDWFTLDSEVAVMGIPHLDGQDVKSFYENFKILDRDSRISMIGISKYAVPKGLSRDDLIDGIDTTATPIHLLGLSQMDGVLEPLMYEGSALPIIGIDSSHYYLHAVEHTHQPPTGWQSSQILKRNENFMEMNPPEMLENFHIDCRLRELVELVGGI